MAPSLRLLAGCAFPNVMRRVGPTLRTLGSAAVAAALVAGCAPEDSANSQSSMATDVSTEPTADPAPEVFAATAWRAIAEDGARYTTYLDPDGTYRDLRNGDPWQSGSWSYSDSEQGKILCFSPAEENGIERCWEPVRMTGKTMRAEGDSGRSIELERVDYEPAEDAGDEPA